MRVGVSVCIISFHELEGERTQKYSSAKNASRQILPHLGAQGAGRRRRHHRLRLPATRRLKGR